MNCNKNGKESVKAFNRSFLKWVYVYLLTLEAHTPYKNGYIFKPGSIQTLNIEAQPFTQEVGRHYR